MTLNSSVISYNNMNNGSTLFNGGKIEDKNNMNIEGVQLSG